MQINQKFLAVIKAIKRVTVMSVPVDKERAQRIEGSD